MEEKILKIPSDNKLLEDDLKKDIKKYIDQIFIRFTEDITINHIPDSIKLFSFDNTELQVIVKKASYIANIENAIKKYTEEEEYESKVVEQPHIENKDVKTDNNDSNNNKESMSREEFQVTTAKNLGFKDMPSNLAQSLLAWTKSGRPVVNAKQWETRLTICRSCSFWSENKNTNVAKCMKCGCGSGKLLLTSSKCPLTPPKWDSL